MFIIDIHDSFLYLGEGLSGFIPGTIGLIQGVSGHTCPKIGDNVTAIPPQFSSQTVPASSFQNTTLAPLEASYQEPLFSVMVFMYMLTLLLIISGVAFILLNTLSFAKKENILNQDSQPLMESTDHADNDGVQIIPPETLTFGRPGLKVILLLLLTVWVNILANGIMPSIQSYSSLPYGLTTYTLGK